MPARFAPPSPTSGSRSKAFTNTLPDNPAVFVGGGNTFRLLKTLQDGGLLDQIRRKVLDGMRYMGSSAGANLACPTIKTTNDMPIVQPADFHALGLVTFQINPHYIDADPNSRHMGETREKRISEFHEENDLTVIGLREGSWIVVDQGRATLHGETGAKIFLKGNAPAEWDRQTDRPA
jgi:dipeptidase E